MIRSDDFETSEDTNGYLYSDVVKVIAPGQAVARFWDYDPVYGLQREFFAAQLEYISDSTLEEDEIPGASDSRWKALEGAYRELIAGSVEELSQITATDIPLSKTHGVAWVRIRFEPSKKDDGGYFYKTVTYTLSSPGAAFVRNPPAKFDSENSNYPADAHPGPRITSRWHRKDLDEGDRRYYSIPVHINHPSQKATARMYGWHPRYSTGAGEVGRGYFSWGIQVYTAHIEGGYSEGWRTIPGTWLEDRSWYDKGEDRQSVSGLPPDSFVRVVVSRPSLADAASFDYVDYYIHVN